MWFLEDLFSSSMGLYPETAAGLANLDRRVVV